MTLTLGPVIGTVGGATWDETPVSGSTTQNQTATLTTVTPPAGGRMLVALVGTATGNVSTATLRIGTSKVGFVTGPTGVAAVVSEATTVQLVHGTAFNTATFTGIVYTMPLPD